MKYVILNIVAFPLLNEVISSVSYMILIDSKVLLKQGLNSLVPSQH
jgi:hypothetical protein